MAADLNTYLRRVLPRLREQSHPDLPEPCQIWTGARRGHAGDDGRGSYGAIWYQGKARRVHRVVWRLLTGAWPRAELAHLCDRTLCCELSHLVDGSHTENMRGAALDEIDEIDTLPDDGGGEVPF